MIRREEIRDEVMMRKDRKNKKNKIEQNRI